MVNAQAVIYSDSNFPPIFLSAFLPLPPALLGFQYSRAMQKAMQDVLYITPVTYIHYNNKRAKKWRCDSIDFSFCELIETLQQFKKKDGENCVSMFDDKIDKKPINKWSCSTESLSNHRDCLTSSSSAFSICIFLYKWLADCLWLYIGLITAGCSHIYRKKNFFFIFHFFLDKWRGFFFLSSIPHQLDVDPCAFLLLLDFLVYILAAAAVWCRVEPSPKMMRRIP